MTNKNNYGVILLIERYRIIKKVISINIETIINYPSKELENKIKRDNQRLNDISNILDILGIKVDTN